VGTPDTKPDTWYDPSELNEAQLTEAIWMATRSSNDSGASWTPWAVTQIKGVKGDDGQFTSTVFTRTEDKT
jgi:hypothetical protein